jgi:hypothetical protein
MPASVITVFAIALVGTILGAIAVAAGSEPIVASSGAFLLGITAGAARGLLTTSRRTPPRA